LPPFGHNQSAFATASSTGPCALYFNADPSLAESLARILSEVAPQLRLLTIPWDPSLAPIPSFGPAPPPQLYFIDVAAAEQEALAFLDRLANSPPFPPVVALLAREDPDLALRCIRTGAWGCLIPPFAAGQLRPILARIQKRSEAPPQEPSGRVIGLASVKGGCGATVLAVTLADQLRRAGAGRILLADLDLVAGAIAFNLKLTSSHSSADALRHASRLDADLWRGLVVSKPEFDVLTAPDLPADAGAEPAALSALLLYVRSSYDWILVDAGTLGAALSVDLAKSADPLLLVLTPEPVALFAAKRWLPHLAASGVSRSRIRLLLNRHSRGRSITAEQAGAALGCEISWTLPDDPSAVHDALIQGKPVAASSSYARQVRQVALALLEASGSLERPSSPKRILTLFSPAT
jgi:pilus assembly protein CpaE